MAAEVAERVEDLEDVEEEELASPGFPDVRIQRKFVINRDDKDYVLYAGLVDMLHQRSFGFFDVQTTLVQAPSQDNNQTAIVTARVVIFDSMNPDVAKQIATGIGDANPSNVTRLMAPHTIRMAETRAVARALRLLTNVGMTAVEELGPHGGEEGPEPGPEPPRRARLQEAEPPTPPVERIQIDGKSWTRPQVVAGYKKVMQEAIEAGLVIPPSDVLADDAALPMLAGVAQGLRKRLDAREGKG